MIEKAASVAFVSSCPLELGNDEKSLVKTEKLGTWVVQPFRCWTLSFGSGHDLRVLG